MDFSLSEEQEAVRSLAAQILDGRLTPERRKEVDASDGRFDRALWSDLAAANLLGISLPEAVGGSGLGFLAAALVLAQQDARLTRMRLDFCAFHGDWRAAGWPRDYFDTWEARKLRQAGVDGALVDRLGLRLERLAAGFRRLGLSADEADRLVTTAELIL